MMGFFNCVRHLTSHACWEDEQLLLCGIIAHAKSPVVHHRGLPAVGGGSFCVHSVGKNQMKGSQGTEKIEHF